MGKIFYLTLLELKKKKRLLTLEKNLKISVIL